VGAIYEINNDGPSTSDENQGEPEYSSCINSENAGDERETFSNVLSKILTQTVDNKVPVLATRKTSVMREIEKERKDKNHLNYVRVQRHADRYRQLVVPTILYADYERQLKKVATRGGNPFSSEVLNHEYSSSLNICICFTGYSNCTFQCNFSS
jgi:hypothetical protein